MIANSYERHLMRSIMHEARNSKDLSELKERLSKKGISVTIKMNAGTRNGVAKLEFKNKRGLDISSVRGKDRVITDLVQKQVKENGKLAQISAQKNQPKANDYYAKIKAMREQNTALQSQNMYNTKGLKR